MALLVPSAVRGTLLVAALLASPAPCASALQDDLATGVTLVRIERELDLGHQAMLRRAVDGARSRGDKLVVELDTPGGEVQLAWRLARMVDEGVQDGVDTTAWIHSEALSAGALIALACETIYVGSAATFGGAQTIAVGLEGVVAVPADEVVDEKLGATWRASFRTFAQDRGRSPELAEAMVDRDVIVRRVLLTHPEDETGAPLAPEERFLDDKAWTDLGGTAHARLLETVCSSNELLVLTGAQAVEYKMAEGVAPTLEDVLERIGMPGAEVRRIARSRSDGLAAMLARIGPLLLVLGLFLGYVELKTPGFGIPGFLSLGCFTLMLVGRYLVGLADIPHILLVAAGVVLVAVELFLVPGTIWVGLLGAAFVVGGLIWSGIGAGVGLEYAMDRELALGSTLRVLFSATAGVVLMWIASRWLPKTPVMSWMVLGRGDERVATASAVPEAEGAHGSVARVGARGRALTALRPVGKVALDENPSLDHEARSSGPEIAVGARIRVVEVRQGRVVVEEAEPVTGDGR